MTRVLKLFCISIFGYFCLLTSAYAQIDPEVTALQQRWAEVNYLLKDKSQIEAFNSLIEDARKVTDSKPDNAEAWLWSGITRSSYAGAKGGLGALAAAKAAKADLEKSLELDAMAVDGAAYTSLGVLYLNVPGWPVAFGDEETGVELLKKGLEISPAGIDSNYFYAQYLFDGGEFSEAQRYLRIALDAQSRPGREIADQGRRAEVEEMLRMAQSKN